MAGQQNLFQQAMNRGHSAAWDQMWQQAAAYYRQALKEIPDHPQALIHLGLALIELQQIDAALGCYERAARVTPNDPLPLEKIGQLYERTGNLERATLATLRAAELYMKNRETPKAIENWQRVISFNPENLQAHSRLAVVFEHLNEKKPAVKEYLAIASLFQAAGKLEKAGLAVQQALKIQPDSLEAAQALSLLKDFKPLPKPVRARGGTGPLRMSQVRQMHPSPDTQNTDEKFNPVELACQAGLTMLAGLLFDLPVDETPGEDVKGIKMAVSYSPPTKKPGEKEEILAHLSQMIDFQIRAEHQQAEKELQKAIDAGLAHPAAYFNLGYLAAENQRKEKAIRSLQMAIKHKDFSIGGRLLLGKLLRESGQIKEAVLYYLEGLKLADVQVAADGQANELRQLYDPMIEALKRQDATALDQLCQNIHEFLMQPDWRERILRARSQLPEREAGKLYPVVEILTEVKSSQLIDAIIRIKQRQKDGYIHTAMEDAYFVLDQAPTYLPLHSLMGDLLAIQGEIPAAVAKYQATAKSYSVRGETEQAIALYRSIVELSPTDFHLRNSLIDQLVAAGKTEQAIKETMILAEVHYRQADFATARKIYTDALRLTQQNGVDRSVRAKILHRMADIDLQSLDWRQALRVFEQIRTLQPDDEKARLRLVDLHLKLKQEPQALAELDQYLSYLHGQGKDQGATNFLENLAKEYPQNVSIRRRLADYYKSSGKNELAVSQLDAIGEILLEKGDKPGAAQTIETILALQPARRADYTQLLEQIRGNTAR